MRVNVNHVHIKAKDPVATAKYYVDNFGARIKQEIANRGLQVDLHGLQLIITTLIKEQTRAALRDRAHGAHHRRLSGNALEAQGQRGSRCSRSRRPTTGRTYVLLAATGGSQIELMEKV